MSPSAGHVRAWDLPTRLFHWALVLLVVASWMTCTYAEAIGDATLRWHRVSGYAVLVLLVWRVLWGIAGPPTARFASFVRGPSVALGYAIDLIKGAKRRYLGHNPLGGWMVLGLLASVAAQAFLGLFTVEHNDLAAGPLYRLIPEEAYKPIRSWHMWTFYNVILPLVGLHIAANVLYAVVLRESLIGAMLTGKKPVAVYVDSAGGSERSGVPMRALLCLALAGVLVFGPLLAVGGRLL